VVFLVFNKLPGWGGVARVLKFFNKNKENSNATKLGFLIVFLTPIASKHALLYIGKLEIL
jgi:hypothetical protein